MDTKICAFEPCDIILGYRNTSGYCRSHRMIVYRTKHGRYTEDPKQYMVEYDAVRSQDPERKRKKRGVWLKTKFGISIEEYEARLEEQDGVCFLCKKGEESIAYNGKGERTAKNLAVDHNETTGLIRKLLCFNCNSGLGKFTHDPVLLRKAAEYLETYGNLS